MDIYAIMGAWSTPIQGVPTTFWGVDGIRYSRAERGKLDQQFKLMETVLYSEELNIQWLNLYTQVVCRVFEKKIARAAGFLLRRGGTSSGAKESRVLKWDSNRQPFG